MLEQKIGRVRKIVPQGFFGFIQIDGQEGSIFFHKNNMETWKKGGRRPAVGSLVKFRLVPSEAKGLSDRAIDVEVL